MSGLSIDLSTLPLDPLSRKYLDDVVVGHVIDGEVVPSETGETMAIINPATGEEIGQAACGGPADLEAAVRSARQAFDDGRWRDLTPFAKEERLRRLADLVAEHREVFSDIDVLDAGLLRSYARQIAQGAVSSVSYYAGWP